MRIKAGRCIVAWVALASTLAIASHAFAFAGESCGTGYLRWGSGTHALGRVSCGAPNGSTVATAFAQSWISWKALNPDLNRFGVTGTFEGSCQSFFPNNFNEFNVVSRSEISGYNGLTWMMPHPLCPFPGGSKTYIEGDVLVASDMNYGYEDPSFFNWNPYNQGQVVIVHEVGHFLGLQHDDYKFNVMHTSVPYPLVGGQLWHGWPQADDAAGSRWLYPGGAAVTNVFASAQKISGQYPYIFATNVQGTYDRCRGAWIAVTITYGNNGNTDVSNKGLRIYMTQSPGTAAGGTNLYTNTFSLNKHSYTSRTEVLQIPASLPLGLYWIQWEVDSSKTLSEGNESDNFVHSAMTVNVNC